MHMLSDLRSLATDRRRVMLELTHADLATRFDAARTFRRAFATSSSRHSVTGISPAVIS